MESKGHNSVGVSLEEIGQKRDLSRRQLLKIIAAGGIAATANQLPNEWIEPTIDVGYLPAHAQTSAASIPSLGTGDFQATLTWNTGNLNANNCFGDGILQGAVDIDLHVIEPDGTRVFYANRIGTTAILDVDNQKGFGPENIFVPTGQVSTGKYRVQIVYFCGAVPTIATIAIKVFANTADEKTFTFTRNLTTANSSLLVNVAEVTYPTGDVEEKFGTDSLSVQNIDKS